MLSDSCGGDGAHPQSTVLRRHTEEGRERWRERWGEAEKEREKERERGLKILIPTTYIGSSPVRKHPGRYLIATVVVDRSVITSSST